MNERGVIVSWLVKLVVGLALLGVVGYDAGSIVVNYFTLGTAAEDTAVAVSLIVDTDQFGTNDEEIYQKTVEVAKLGESGAATAKVVHSGTFVDEEKVIHVKLKRTADTLIVKRIPLFAKWARSTAEGTSLAN